MLQIPTNPQIADIFSRLIAQKRLASTYLFYGPPGSGKWQAAIEIAAEVLGLREQGLDQNASERAKKLIHPDLHLVFPLPSTKETRKGEEEKAAFIAQFLEAKRQKPYLPFRFDQISSIHVRDVQAMRQEHYKFPLEGGYRVAIIEKAETLIPTSFDTLLKTIEEPPPLSLILILTDNYDRVPETIRSRCQKIRFKRVAPEFIREYLIKDKGLDHARAEFITALSFGSLSRAERLLDVDFWAERESAIAFLGSLLSNPLEAFWTEFEGAMNLSSKSTVENLLVVWQTLFHDIALLNGGAESSKLINKDQEKIVGNLAGQVGSFENAVNGLGNLLSLQKLFYRNINPALAFFNAAARLKSNLPPLYVRD